MQSTERRDGAAVYMRLLNYLRPNLTFFVLSIVGWMIFAATQPAAAKLLEILVDAIEQKDYDARYYIPLAVIALYVVRGVGSFMGTYFMSLVSTRVVNTLRQQTFTHIMALPTQFYDDHNSGQLISRIVFNTEMVTGSLTDALKTLFREGLTIIGLLGYAFYLNWKMSITFLVIAPFLALIVTVVGRRMRKLSTRVQDTLAEITQTCSEAIGNNRVVKTFLGEEYEIGRFFKATENNLKQQMKIVKMQSINTPVLQLVVVMAMGFIVFMLLQPAFLDDMSTGQYVAYITAIGLIPKPVRQLSNVNSIIQKGIAAAISIFDTLDLPTEVNRGTLPANNIRGELRVEQLNFQYPESERPALADVSFEARPGQVVALVGRSGSGKSTLASLLARFYDYEDGHIRLDGVDIRDYDLKAYRQNIGLVTQSVALFNDTIANNIAYGCNDNDDDAIRAAAEQAHAAEFIDNLPEGYQTMVGESGVKLSGGQRQRIAIARTLLKNTPILILDEATSALDNESERAIQEALDIFMQSRTTIVIAHRLSTIVNADLILVMENGRIVESGNHQQLLEHNQHYAKLYEQGFEDN